MSGDRYGAAYYDGVADALGWGAASTPDPFKLALLRREVRGRRVLDVGCGPGLFSAALADAGRTVIGCDFTRSLLAAGRARSAGWLPVCGSGLALPFRDRSVDTVLLLSILEHVDDAAMLREAARVARERVIVQVPLAEPRLLTDVGVLFSHWSDRSHLRTYDEAGIRALAAGAELRMTSFVPAYPRDLQELYVRGLAVPAIVRMMVRAVLRPLRAFAPRPAAEAFAVLEHA